MKMQMFAVLDTKTGTFGYPACDIREESAIRQFSDAVNDGSRGDNAWNRHPEDFALYHIAEYETTTGEITPVSKMRCIVTASALKSLRMSQQELDLNGVQKPEVVQ